MNLLILIVRTLLTLLLALPLCCFSQQPEKIWHGVERSVHYLPDDKDFVLVNGQKKFNRALYGGNTGFRAEAGDLPEFALYLPGMGGNLKFGLIKNDHSKWLTSFAGIQTRYRPGSMIYQLEDSLLGTGSLKITALATFEKEGLLIKVETKQIEGGCQLVTAYGGATGLKFSRDGDIGADPESSFYLQPAYCIDNIYRIQKNSFELFFGSKRPLSETERYEIQYRTSLTNDSVRALLKMITGKFPTNSKLKIADANRQTSPIDFFNSIPAKSPALVSVLDLYSDSTYYFFIQPYGDTGEILQEDLAALWKRSENKRQEIASRIEVVTPDSMINTLGGALGIAADAIWEEPSYLHGAVAWRMRLNGWRGAYVADVLGWHDRAKKHFSSYAKSQLTSPATAPVIMDTALHLARSLEKLGTSMFSSGYISRNPNGDFRAHHYDMNLVFVDQLLNHFQWTGDTAFLRECWPLLTRHMDWEKRNFDADGDGLYDSYAAIWASDALQYSGGGVTHSSAYNFRTNSLMTKLAGKVNQDAIPFRKEADRILKAINRELWLKDKGWYAEYKDLLGNKLLHTTPALWTIYHTTDSKVPDKFQAYQLLNYVRLHLPHISVRAKGISDTSLYTLSTSNWQPYTWSLNNVALAELMHTALSYWQAGKKEEAYQLWKSSLIESMYLGVSPGNFQQLSFYDAMRGELYRDFADPIAMTARSLVEGLFGIYPDAISDTLFIWPGLPDEWDHAKLNTPDFKFSFQRNGNIESYTFHQNLPSRMNLNFRLKARAVGVEKIIVNGKTIVPKYNFDAVGFPEINILFPNADKYEITINWSSAAPDMIVHDPVLIEKEYAEFNCVNASILDIYDPQNVLGNISKADKKIRGLVVSPAGNYCFFVQLKQGDASWWQPVSIKVEQPLNIHFTAGYPVAVTIQNNLYRQLNTALFINDERAGDFKLAAKDKHLVRFTSAKLLPGTNQVSLYTKDHTTTKVMLNWSIPLPANISFDKINISSYFNEEVNNIFKQAYLSPRPAATVLQLPIQGIGNWAYPLTTAHINDSIFRTHAGERNEYKTKAGIPFSTPGKFGVKNIAFTSQWDNFPDSLIIPLTGKSSHAYFLMAGSTNPMQSRMINGEIYIRYKDGSVDRLLLKNPENWWPIEQDYYIDGFAFTTGAPKPPRIYFKYGEEREEYGTYDSIRGFSNFAVKNGAATILDLPLNPQKEIREMVLKTIANDVIIGLMSVTLVR